MKSFSICAILLAIICSISNDHSIILAARVPLPVRHQEEFKISPRFGIHGGETADENEAPYIVALFYSDKHHTKKFYCSGSLISPSTVLTTAYCAQSYVSHTFHVRYGTNNRDKSPYADMNVSRVIIHEEFIEEIQYNDIALMILPSPVTPSSNVGIIDIEMDNLPDGAPVTLYGWGQMDLRNTWPKKLQRGKFHIVGNDQCGQKWKKYLQIDDTQICAYEKGKGACVGDDGGPLVSSNKRLVGIQSITKKLFCEPTDFMDIYVRASHYAEWIKKNMVH